MPKALISHKLEKGNAKRMSCRDLLAMRWKDKKNVPIYAKHEAFKH